MVKSYEQTRGLKNYLPPGPGIGWWSAATATATRFVVGRGDIEYITIDAHSESEGRYLAAKIVRALNDEPKAV